MVNPVFTRVLATAVGLYCFVLTSCGDGDDSATVNIAAERSAPPAAPALTVAFSVKQIHFSWNAVNDAAFYKLFKNIDGASGFTQMDDNITTTTRDRDFSAHLSNEPATRYLVEACNAAGCTASREVNSFPSVLQAIGYVKASNTDANDHFSTSLALSGDGNTLAVGAPDESSNAVGIDGNQANNQGSAGSGAVYIFVRRDHTWTQQAYVKASNTSAGDAFGGAVSLSDDGNTLAVGAALEDSLGIGVNGNQGGISANGSNRGAVYVFIRSGGRWSQQAYVKSSGGHDDAYFGGAVSLAGDGNTLSVGAIGERTGGMDAGAVYVFARNVTVWSQQALLKASIVMPGAHFGSSLAHNSNGDTLAVGAPDEYNGNNVGGSVYVFTRSAKIWAPESLIKASNSAAFDSFGSSVALNGNGTTLAVGAGAEASSATGINGNQADRSASNAGAVYVFSRAANVWSQQAYVKASNAESNDYFGATSVAMSGDGNLLAVAAIAESSSATGIGGDQTNSGSAYSGAVYVFTRRAAAWSQLNYLKAPNTGAGDLFGRSLALSHDGNVLAVGASGESSSAQGVGGNQSDENASGAGAVYLY